MSEAPSPSSRGAPSASLLALLDALRDGVVLVDRDRHVSYVNRAAGHQLGLPDSQSSDTQAFVAPATSGTTEVGLNVEGGTWTAIIMRERPGVDALDQRRLAAFARTAARAGCMGSLQSTLDALAAEVLSASGAVACTVIVTDPHSGEVSVSGSAGSPRDHLQRVQEAIRRGAPLRTLATAGDRTVRVERNLGALVRDDERFAPLAPTVSEAQWTSLVSAPLVGREACLGALTAFYAATTDPDEAEVAFLSAMADHATLAVNTSLLFVDAQAEATVQERHRLARDLHDSVTQNLYSLVLHTRATQGAAARLASADSAIMADRLQTLHTLAEAALDDMRSALTHLRGPTDAGDSGLIVAVREHATTVAEREAVDVQVSVPGEPLLLSVEAEDELFRVITEAVANSVHHARPTRIDVAITAPGDRDELVITISDDGTGFDPACGRPGHIGLVSMRERTHRLGGELTIDSCETGTTVRAVVPCRRWPPRRLGDR